MTRTTTPPTPIKFSICHPVAQAEAVRLMAEHAGRALRVVENELTDLLAKGDYSVVLHLDQVRRALANSCPEPDGSGTLI